MKQELAGLCASVSRAASVVLGCCFFGYPVLLTLSQRKAFGGLSPPPRPFPALPLEWKNDS